MRRNIICHFAAGVGADRSRYLKEAVNDEKKSCVCDLLPETFEEPRLLKFVDVAVVVECGR